VVKLLLDENLSPRAALDLRDEGHDVIHLRERGRLGIADPEVLELAFAEDRALVTANVGDFRKLAAAREVHAGIVLLLDGGLRREEQLEVPRRVIVALEAEGDLVNRALTVALDGAITMAEVSRPVP
jgi:predicted nuclease of predicted toxin-antitoxin system